MYSFIFLKKWEENVYLEYSKYAPLSDELRQAVFDKLTDLLGLVKQWPHVATVGSSVVVGSRTYEVRLTATNAAYAAAMHKLSP